MVLHGSEQCYRAGCRRDECRKASAAGRRARYAPTHCHRCDGALPGIRGRRYCDPCREIRRVDALSDRERLDVLLGQIGGSNAAS
jgi:hypothetical protein